MKRLLPLLLLASFVGCGHTTQAPRAVPPRCQAVPAQAGCSLPKQSRTLTVPRGAVRTVPDISEFQGCPLFTGPVIFKVYEGGYGQDHSARCNVARVHRLHVWAGVYAFLRPVNCTVQGKTTASIVRALGGVPGPIVADAEVPLPAGCVRQFLAQVGSPQDIYTSPGTWPGGGLSAPLWVATYGPRPGCVAGVCSHVAWQFTDNGRCGGLVGVDCSIATGILSQSRQPRPKPKPTPPKPTPAQQRISLLRSLARRHGCYVKHVQHKHACLVWAREVRQLEHH